MEVEYHIANNVCWNNGIRIYCKPYGFDYYKIVVSQATKLKWNQVPADKRSSHEIIEGVVYKFKIGEMAFKIKPTMTDPKWEDKIHELYANFYKTIIEKNGNSTEKTPEASK